jgi:type II secretory pathway component PulM
MENETAFTRLISRIGDKLSEQAWFQQLKAKWDELDPQSRTYLKFAAAAASAGLVVLMVLSSMWRVHSLKKELAEKSELLATIQTATDELRRLRDSLPASAQAARATDQAGPWPGFFETTAATAGIEKGSLTISPEKSGSSSDLAKEALIDIAVRHVSIKQVVRYAFNIENGSRPVKLRNLTIDTKADPTGYMDATLSVSAFTLKDTGGSDSSGSLRSKDK